MEILSSLMPYKVFSFFEKICSIPHGSGNTQAISNYIADFASERKLDYNQDKFGNIIIFKNASEGFENSEPVMLQGHIDMVAVADSDCKKDLSSEGLDIAVDGDYIYAKNTSLGGDDGIAVAYMLALLDSDTIPHPPIEAVFTVDEETGMNGAKNIDLSICKSKRLLNIDSEEEGVFLSGCAGGASFQADMPVTRENITGSLFTLKISGLHGGHSGMEIDKGYANANLLIAEIIYSLCKKTHVYLYDIQGGEKDNAIPSSASVSFIMDEKYTEELHSIISEISQRIKEKDSGFCVPESDKKYTSAECLSSDDTKRFAELVLRLPCGVIQMNNNGFVETSANNGIISCSKNKVTLRYSVRSSSDSEKNSVLDKMSELCRKYGLDFSVSGIYPGWEYKAVSPLRDTMIKVYRNLYGSEPSVKAIHAGVECGFFAEKISGLDCISFGPDIINIHTPEEKLSISSVQRVWNFLTEVLRNL